MNENEDRRVKPMQGDNQQQPQQHERPPQKCPRCDSPNTKFCYYNNYSLSQPRYFCKTCRRYWTQGGTLRNVPVGGGSRKGKRSKTSSTTSSSSSSGDNSRSQPPQVPQNLVTPQNIVSSSAGTGNTVSAALGGRNLASPYGISSMVLNYPGGGHLSSLAAIQSLNNQQPPLFSHHQPVNNSINLSVDLGDSSNLGLLHGFNAVPSYGSAQHHQIQQQRHFFHGDNAEAKSKKPPFYAREEGILRPPSSSQHQNWHQGGYISSSSPTDTALWSISTTATTTTITTDNTNNSNNTTVGLSSLKPDHHWHDLPGYGHPP